ncbi:MAG: ferredoxin [Puniceicoccales bacterium]|jgi:ferredoxin|nr:ferredoxin [Puniceicoccales bacterium]
MAFVAVKENKVDGSISGKFYVDDQCIDCDRCRELCPSCFGRDEELGYSIVIKQPETQEEEDLCQEAMSTCPVEAIGDDGE